MRWWIWLCSFGKVDLDLYKLEVNKAYWRGYNKGRRFEADSWIRDIEKDKTYIAEHEERI